MAFNKFPSLVILENLNSIDARFNILLELVESLQYSVTLAYCMPENPAPCVRYCQVLLLASDGLHSEGS